MNTQDQHYRKSNLNLIIKRGIKVLNKELTKNKERVKLELKDVIINQFNGMDIKDFDKIFEEVVKEKQYMNEIIEGLSKTTNEFSYKILAYVVQHYEPDYFDLLNNLFVEAIFEPYIRNKYEEKDILGEIVNQDDHKFYLSSSQQLHDTDV